MSINWTLNKRPDGFGFVYGVASRGDEVVRVNVLPPLAEWVGDTVLEGYEPEAGVWKVYADGELVARVEREELLADAMLPLLDASQE